MIRRIGFTGHLPHVTRHTRGIAEFLFQQQLEILRRETAEKPVQTFFQDGFGKTRFCRAEFQGKLAELIFRLPPIRRDFAEDFYNVRHFTRLQIFCAVALQRVTSRRDHRGRECRFRQQVGKKIVGQVHLSAECGARSAE